MSKRLNGSLWLGGVIVALFVLMAAVGHKLAPRDPMTENYVFQIDGKIITPPIRPFAVRDYPLGADVAGRDVLSRLLWAVRPTMMMVIAVAAARLLLGLAIGLLSGWSQSWLGRFLETATSAALAVPVLIIALAGITAVGQSRGLVAFIIGLALTGWAETGRMVHEQTRAIKGQAYVEAARALGASGQMILLRHVLRQIAPMVWMLLAFEVSSTLLVASELGFLGYYIGGGAWIEVSDFAAVNIAGLPELGQMLASSMVSLTAPWVMLVVGTVIFAAILGFNLLGEGLRLELSPEQLHQRTLLSTVTERVGRRVQDTLMSLEDLSPRTRRLVWGIVAGVVVVVVGGVILWRGQGQAQQPPMRQELIIPGGHLWATERRDPFGTLYADVTGPQQPEIAWVWQNSEGLAGGPAVAADGVLYVASSEGVLWSIAPDGQPRWQVALEVEPVGAPALGSQGDIYIADKAGGLSAVSPDGKPMWRFRPSSEREATSGPIVGPDGTIYYTTIDAIQAVTPQGDGLWKVLASDYYVYMPPRLAPNDRLVFLKEGVVDLDDGTLLDFTKALVGEQQQFVDPMYFVGANGELYYLSGNTAIQWRRAGEEIELLGELRWATPSEISWRFPTDVGTTRERFAWMFYASQYYDTTFVWIDQISAQASQVRLPMRRGELIGVDQFPTAYLCNSQSSAGANCLALRPGSDKPVWEIPLDQGHTFAGGALAPGRLYVAIEEGFLYALSDVQ